MKKPTSKEVHLGKLDVFLLFRRKDINRAVKGRKPFIKKEGVRLSWSAEDGYIISGDLQAIERIMRRLEVVHDAVHFRQQLSKAYEESPSTTLGKASESS